jgi:hypothetical protein
MAKFAALSVDFAGILAEMIGATLERNENAHHT